MAMAAAMVVTMDLEPFVPMREIGVADAAYARALAEQVEGLTDGQKYEAYVHATLLAVADGVGVPFDDLTRGLA